MSYNADNQYRCDIVRSRSIRNVDNYLLVYAEIINEMCPCSKEAFTVGFNNAMREYLIQTGHSIVDTKTLANHRTETAKTLFGMYYVDENGMVQMSERTKRFLADRDRKAFFKDLCYKLQFPNGMNAPQTIIKRVVDGVHVYPCRFLVKTMQIAEKKGIRLTRNEIGYYILNSTDVLTGESTPAEVVDCIISNRKKGIVHFVPKSTYYSQHISGIIKYMDYAGLIMLLDEKSGSGAVMLNHNEDKALDIFAKNLKDNVEFQVGDYVVKDGSKMVLDKEFRLNWDLYNSKISNEYRNFRTLPEAKRRRRARKEPELMLA